ncbi:MAG TPA: SpoIIE family protein phosphatase, partial [Bryobacteraceae bacterium]|nr:SpoIIE family protein phosphatase [Bryobacteraceae bacterium]
MKIRIGAVEWAFVALLLIFVGLSWSGLSTALSLVTGAALLVTGGWASVRLTRVLVQKLLWRLRNRLIVAYIFIALVPVVLITLLVQLGATLTGGQIAVYLISSELDHRLATLRTAVDLMQTGPESTASEAVLARQFPGLQLTVERAGPGLTSSPTRGSMPVLPVQRTSGSGIGLKDNALYGWARAVRGGERITAVFPITREFLGDLVPGLCESTIVDMGSGRVLLAPSARDTEASGNRLPPATRFADFEIRWGAPLPIQNWTGRDNAAEARWLTVRSRPSALLRTFLQQRANWASEVIPIFIFTVAIAFCFAEVIALIIGVSLTRTITSAVHELYLGTLRVRSGDFSHKIPIGSQDQLGELAISFNQMTENVERLLAVEKERERLQAELEIAREVQNQLYPRSVPALQCLRVTATCNPARMVSGDYYDYQQIGESKVAIAIGDVAGKGISAALLMATIQSSFRSQLRGSLEMAVSAGAEQTSSRIQVSTSQMATHLNQQLFADTSPEKYATLYLGLFDEAGSKLTYTNAGHLPPILIRNGESTRLDVNGMVVGAFPFARYDESEVVLQPGDVVVFFTDGITEPENAYGEMYGEERLLELLLRTSGKDDREIIDCVIDSVKEWTGAGELQDDMT